MAPALRGLSLSYKLGNKSYNDLYHIAKRLCNKDGGHNKFLEAIQVWIDITGPLYWWKQFDTYRVGITKQSESTMHTIMKHPIEQSDFQYDILDTHLNFLNALRENKEFKLLINNLPDGYKQRRIVNTNYKTLRHIIQQRKDHKLDEWVAFIEAIKRQAKYPQLLGEETRYESDNTQRRRDA